MIATPQDELLSAIDAHFQTLLTERGDEQFAHVSDTFGCDYATWTRRQGGFKRAPRSSEAILKMALGNDVERYVCNALEEHYLLRDGFSVRRNERIAWNPNEGQGMSYRLHEDENPQEDETVGHFDFLAMDTHREDGELHLIEVKSTSFLKGRVPAEPSPHYVEQAATYGIAVGATHCGIIVVCRESGRIAPPFWLDLNALEFATIERAKRVIEATNPDAHPPDPVPRYGWQPKYCGLGDKCACAIAARENSRHSIEVKS
jgi:hypothetical protein